MTKSQLTEAVKLAKDQSIRFIDDNGKHLVDISIFDGFGLPNFQPVVCTVKQLAALIRWQCMGLHAELDAQALNEIATAGKSKFTVVG